MKIHQSWGNATSIELRYLYKQDYNRYYRRVLYNKVETNHFVYMFKVNAMLILELTMPIITWRIGWLYLVCPLHHSSRGRPKLIIPWASKWRVRSVVAIQVSTNPGESGETYEERRILYSVRPRIPPLLPYLKVVPCRSASFPLEIEEAYPVIRNKVACSLNRPLYRTLTSGKQK
jgi:hypothetical protein